MKVFYKIVEKLEDELEDICKDGKLTGSDIETMGEMVDIIKDIKTIEAMKNETVMQSEYGMNGGYSGNYNYADANRRGYSEAWPYRMPMYARDGGMNGDGGYSMARGRDAMGRYTSRDADYNYSRDHSKDEIIHHMNEAMMNSRSDEEREKYRKAIEQLSR